MNTIITSKEYRIYDMNKGLELYEANPKKYSPKKLSIMKHENIKEAIEKEMNIDEIKQAFRKYCGYCFAFYDYLMTEYGVLTTCERCPIFKLRETDCDELDEYEDIFNTDNLTDLKEAHKEFCNAIGFNIY